MNKLIGQAPLLAVLISAAVLFGSPQESSGAPPPKPISQSQKFFDPEFFPPPPPDTFFAEQGAAATQLDTVSAGGSDQCGTTAQSTQVPDSNAVTITCAAGKIHATVGNEQQFANHIGGIVEVKIELIAPDSVRFDLRSLQSGMLKFDGTKSFQLAKDNPVRITQVEIGSGETLYTINLRVQTFVPQPSVPFNVDLRYATDSIAGTSSLEWKVLTTPTFLVKMSKTKDDGEVLLQGNMQPATIQTPAAIPWLFGAGGILVGSWPLVSLLTWLNRRRPSYKAPANQVAWSIFEVVFKDASARGYEESHFHALMAALTDYLDIGTLTSTEINARFQDDLRLDTIHGAIDKCVRALYGGEQLSIEELVELTNEIESLVPKPE